MVLVHPEKEYLLLCRKRIEEYLRKNLLLNLHPKKFYLQHFSKGVPFLGVFIKPFRIYAGTRCKRNFNKRIETINKNVISSGSQQRIEDQLLLRSNINSYLGLMKNYKTFKLRTKIISKLNPLVSDRFSFAPDLTKAQLAPEDVLYDRD